MTELTRVWPLPAASAVSDQDIADWYERPDRTQPWLRMNFVSSLDGAVTVGGLSGGLGTTADRRVFDALRILADVVIVGAGTVRAEGYGPMRVDAADARRSRGLPEQPVFAIVSRDLDLDASGRIFTDAPVRPIVITCEAADQVKQKQLAAVADVLVCGRESVEGGAMKSALAARGLTQMHSEGGPHLFGSMVTADAVDELCLTLSPLIAGGHAPRIIAGADELLRTMRLGHVIEGEGTLLLRYVRG